MRYIVIMGGEYLHFGWLDIKINSLHRYYNALYGITCAFTM